MKQAFFLSAVLFVVIISCGPTQQLAQDPSLQDIKISIEFRDDNNTRQNILQTMRPARPKDIATVAQGDVLDTEAIFTNVSPRDFELIKRIEQQLKLIPGVINVELKRPSRPVMQTGYNAP